MWKKDNHKFKNILFFFVQLRNFEDIYLQAEIAIVHNFLLALHIALKSNSLLPTTLNLNGHQISFTKACLDSIHRSCLKLSEIREKTNALS